MPAKTKTSGYVFILYNGCMKLGTARSGYLEDGDIETHLETFKEHYGNKVKGRYVKSSTPKEHFDALHQKFNEFAEGECVYKVNTTNLVNGLREVTGSKTSKTWNVYPGSEEEADADASGKETEQEQPKTTKGKVSAKVEAKEDEADEEDEEEPSKPAKKTVSKAKSTKSEDAEEETPKTATKKAVPKAKVVKVEVEEEEEADEEEKPAPKPKKVVAKK